MAKRRLISVFQEKSTGRWIAGYDKETGTYEYSEKLCDAMLFYGWGKHEQFAGRYYNCHQVELPAWSPPKAKAWKPKKAKKKSSAKPKKTTATSSTAVGHSSSPETTTWIVDTTCRVESRASAGSIQL